MKGKEKYCEIREMERVDWESILEKDVLPYICLGADETSRNIAWVSPSQAGDAYIFLGEDSSLKDCVKFNAKTYKLPNSIIYSNHTTVSDLLPDKEYYYQCFIGDNKSDVYSFKTTAPSDSFRCLYVSDIHVGSSAEHPEVLTDGSLCLHNLFCEALNRDADISLILSGGDQASSGKADEYKGLVSSPVVRSIPFNTIVGNHDKKNFAYTYFNNNPNFNISGSHSFIGSDHWFTHNNALFICIDSNNPCLGDHIKTFETAFGENPHCKWKVLMIHHDLYGGHNKNRSRENRLLAKLLVPLIDKYGIDLVTGGHSHYYSRSHILHNKKIVEKTDEKSETFNPKGTIFLTSGSVNCPRNTKVGYLPGHECAADHISTDDRIYNILDFQADRLTIRSYALGKEKPFETFSIVKHGLDGGHPKTKFPPYYGLYRGITLIYGLINNRIEINRLHKKGIFK